MPAIAGSGKARRLSDVISNSCEFHNLGASLAFAPGNVDRVRRPRGTAARVACYSNFLAPPASNGGHLRREPVLEGRDFEKARGAARNSSADTSPAMVRTSGADRTRHYRQQFTTRPLSLLTSFDDMSKCAGLYSTQRQGRLLSAAKKLLPDAKAGVQEIGRSHRADAHVTAVSPQPPFYCSPSAASHRSTKPLLRSSALQATAGQRAMGRHSPARHRSPAFSEKLTLPMPCDSSP